MLTSTYTLDRVGDAALAVHHNEAEGKLGVLCLAPGEGLGVDDPEKRARIGEDRITMFRS
jgi:crotonyl-CoA reductase